jgi:two-component system CheB/CheR fusion protein
MMPKTNPPRRKPRVLLPAAAPTPESLPDSAPEPSSTGAGDGAVFPVVGIGCSAGGLEALEKFLSQTPANPGMAFVVVQHLAPAHPSALPGLLQRYTKLPVAEAVHGQRLEPDCLYVIPPDCDLAVREGCLQVLAPLPARGLRLPVDLLLRSLAADCGERAVGIILSGMGSDGVLGLRAIKEQGGLVIVQDPASAQSENMPAAAIAAGVADIVTVPEAMFARLSAYLRHPPPPLRLAVPPAEAEAEAPVQAALDRIVVLLRDRSGNDFSLYKTNTLFRRIERRMGVHQIGNITGYATFLAENPQELDLLFHELLIGVTQFFRDPAVWAQLRGEIFPALFTRHPKGLALRAWVAACSTGEEAYSLAISFKEALAQAQPPAHFSLQIYATDLDPDAINAARKGCFPPNIAADVSAEQLASYFVADEAGGYRLTKPIREMVVFATQNIISDPPFTKLDLLFCRNLLIYFSSGLQKRLLPLFHYALRPGACLVLGSAETVGSFTGLFAPINAKARIFQRLDSPRQLGDLHFPGSTMNNSESDATQGRPAVDEHYDDLGRLTDQIIQQHWAPAAVLVNADGDILYISGRTGKYLEPAAGRTNINIHAMAREGLREVLVGAIHRAVNESQQVQLNGLRVGTNGGTQIVNLVLHALENPATLRGRVLVVFQDVAAPPAKRRSAKRITAESERAVQQEIDQLRQALQVNHEEMQTTVEELKSSNEELQSTNEELQSTNEELTTSKEELQSLNEELQTVNAELQAKVDDLDRVRNDMANLLNSTEIATIFLDGAMQLRRYTTYATGIFKLIPGDVGRPLSHIVTELDYPQLKDDALEVLRTLIFKELEVSASDERYYRVRIMPYRTLDDVIDGVVITFIDISETKQLEAALRARGA